jgi:hypothetical protein
MNEKFDITNFKICKMDNLPVEIQALIISKADVPIDTYLYYRKVGAIPKKMKLENYDFINKIYETRIHIYKHCDKFKMIFGKYGTINLMDNYRKIIFDNKSLAISVYMQNDITKLFLRIYKHEKGHLNCGNMLIYDKKTVVDIHTGKLTESL